MTVKLPEEAAADLGAARLYLVSGDVPPSPSNEVPRADVLAGPSPIGDVLSAPFDVPAGHMVLAVNGRPVGAWKVGPLRSGDCVVMELPTIHIPT